MTAPGVGVRGGIRPPGIPSSAVTPRGFSSLSHGCDAVAPCSEWGCSWSRQEGLQREDSAAPALGKGSIEEIPWTRRRAMLWH